MELFPEIPNPKPVITLQTIPLAERMRPTSLENFVGQQQQPTGDDD